MYVCGKGAGREGDGFMEDMEAPDLSALIQESKGGVDSSCRLSYCTEWGTVGQSKIRLAH